MDRTLLGRDDGAEVPRAEVDRLAADAMREHNLPGISIVVRAGGNVYERHAGIADLRSNRTVTRDTVFRLGSVTKTFTALAVVQLAEQGRLDLDAPVNDYLTKLRVEGPSPNGPPITIRQLLTHTSGIGVLRRTADLFRPMSGLAAAVGEQPPPLTAYYGGTVRAELEPCRTWIYTNHGYAVLGQMIEDLTGASFGEYVEERVLRPLGMLDTRMSLDDSLRARLATGYSRRRGKFSAVEFREVIVTAAGAAVSTPADLARYLSALLGGGKNESGGIVRREAFASMLERQYELHPALPAMGLGFALKRLGKHRVAWHNGAWIGFASVLLLAPDRKVAVAIVTNTRTHALDSLGWSLMRLLLGVKPAEKIRRDNAHSRGSHRRDLAGVYEPAHGLGRRAALRAGAPRALVVRQKDARLTIRSRAGGGARSLFPAGADDPLIFQFVQDDDTETVVFGTDARDEVDSLAIALHRLRKKRRRSHRRTAPRQSR